MSGLEHNTNFRMKQQFNEAQDQRMTKSAHQHPPQKCPRCESLNTKFCYYNNYSLSQPRYFCKTCRRYWTQGGTLRNVPVGGGCRRGKRPKTSSSSSNSSSLPVSVNQTHHQQQQQQDHSLPSGEDHISVNYQAAAAGGLLSSLSEIHGLAGGSSSNLVPFYGVGFDSNPCFEIHEQQQQFYPSNSAAVYPSGSPNMSINNMNNTVVGSSSSSSLNPNLWSDHHLPGYGPP